MIILAAKGSMRDLSCYIQLVNIGGCMYLTDEELRVAEDRYKRYVQVSYSLPEELNTSTVVVRPTWSPDSLSDPVGIGEGLFVDRSEFHGKGTILVHEIHE